MNFILMVLADTGFGDRKTGQSFLAMLRDAKLTGTEVLSVQLCRVVNPSYPWFLALIYPLSTTVQ